MTTDGLIKRDTETGNGSLTIVGLGPGAAGHLSLETLGLLETHFVILRTEIHPTVAELKRRGISYVSCDTFYEREATFEEVYDKIASFVIEQAREPACSGADSGTAARKSETGRNSPDC